MTQHRFMHFKSNAFWVSTLSIAFLMWGNHVFACQENPGKPTIGVTGAGSLDATTYYVAIPDSGNVDVTITGSGDTPCPTEQEKCKCNDQTKPPETEGDPKYTFSKTIGEQDEETGTINWQITPATSPGEYKFKVTRIEQQYKACASGWTGGVSSKSNTQASDEITVIAFKVDLKDITITGVGTQSVYKAGGDVILAGQQADVRGKATLDPASAATKVAPKIKLRLVQNIKGTQSAALIIPPPNGYMVQSANYIADITLAGVTAIAGTGGELTGPAYFDTPNVKVQDNNSYDVMYMNVELRAFLQYSVDGGTWKTVGIRDWTSTGTATNGTSTGWTGSATSATSGHAGASSLVPVTTGTHWNFLPKTPY